MEFNEIIVVLAGLMIGYWAVSKYMAKSDKSADPHGQEDYNHEDKHNGDANPDKSWYEILEVSENASLEEVTDAYKKKIRQYHPDKVDSLGGEFKKLAEEKSKEINVAYAEAKKGRR